MVGLVETMMTADSLRLTAYGPDEGEIRVLKVPLAVVGRQLGVGVNRTERFVCLMLTRQAWYDNMSYQRRPP
jgi:hypothetical protein